MDSWQSKYDDWKLSNNIDSHRQRKGYAGKWGTVEYAYMVDKLGKCPCCEEDVLEDELYVVEMKNDDEVFFHYSCFNYMKKETKEDKDE